MNKSNNNNKSGVKVWVKKQLELRRDYLELLIKRGYSKKQAGFDINKQLKSIIIEIIDIEQI